ncbi:MAG TPA: prolipoprotein diacylglyceryl transferase [Ktedonobacteraceae bacterium]|nr:prolipoprotein diacylglyceryl transferase [Ktedonobacteraceae bacterium]
MGIFPMFAYVINWGWLRIGPPYIYININPVLAQIGPLALHWYGLMYVVGILVGLWTIQGYIKRKGIDGDLLYRLLWWCIVAGLIGGRLYFVIQQPDLWQDYILKPWNILATWEGGMAFFGAIFLVIAVLFWRARVERVNPLVLVDAGVIFATAGQICGRIGNLINGDIIGYPSTLPWSTVYQNPHSFACMQGFCNVPVQPAAAYEIISNLIMLGILFWLASWVRRPGILALVYLFGYCISQFVLFFWRANLIVSFLGISGLKQAQWTSIVLFVLLIPISFIVLRVLPYSKPVPPGEPAITYGIPQKPKPESGGKPEGTEAEEQQPEAENNPQPSGVVSGKPLETSKGEGDIATAGEG